MSTQNRSSAGRKASKIKTQNSEVATEGKEKKVSAENQKVEKEKVQVKPTAEQIRIAQITDIKGGIEDPKIREKVLSLMETTQRSEEDVCCALYECDNDLDRAVIFLLEQLPVGAFATTSKKKKNKSKEDNNAGDSDWNNENAAPNASDTRDKGRIRQGHFSNGNKGSLSGRSRDKKRDERFGNSEFKVDTFRSASDREKGRLPKNSLSSTSRPGRPNRLGQAAGRSNYRENKGRNAETQEIDSWDASQGIVADKQKEVTIDTWGDWDNEEYTGSLTDTKVFTPSAAISGSASNQPDIAAPPGLDQQLHAAPVQQIDSYSSAISGTTNASSTNQTQYSDLHSGSTAAQQLRQALDLPQIQSTVLTAEQSQYFNALSSQNNATQYSSSYGSNQFGGPETSTRSRRSRVPPPSKIPSSAVEMPGDNMNNMGYIDVQFGGLDFGTDDSFDQVTDKFREASLDPSQSISVTENSDYTSKGSSQTAGLAGNALQQSQLLTNSDGITSTADQINSRSLNNGSSSSNATFSLNKPESYISQGSTVGNAAYQGGTFSSNSKMTPYQQVHNAYGSSYTNPQNANFTSAANSAYNSFSQSGNGAFQQSSGGVSNAVGNVASNTPQSNSASANQAHSNSQTVNSNSSYLSNQYSTSSAANYVSQNSYQTNQAFGTSSISSNQGASTTTSTTNSSITSASLSSPSLGLTSSKTVNSTAKSGSAAVLPNIPMVSQYIQTPGGMPFYQPQVYSYEDLQMIQPRVSHMPGYYDLNYQTPTSLGAAGVREGNLGSGVAYSTMSDARFTRTDNNSSPVSNVPSTISQQTGSGGPMLNLPYAYFYSGNAMMPGGFQYGAPALYPQQMPTANATTGGQFPKPSYNANYGSSSYDNLSQGNQEYGKTSYGNSGGQTKPQSSNNQQSGGNNVSEISSSMYGKSHTALSKSYENKSYHSGTPPPFNLVGSQNTLNNASAQPYGSQHLYIPTIPAPHHNISMHQPHQESSRQPAANQGKSAAKQGYSPSYWTAQN